MNSNTIRKLRLIGKCEEADFVNILKHKLSDNEIKGIMAGNISKEIKQVECDGVCKELVEGEIVYIADTNKDYRKLLEISSMLNSSKHGGKSDCDIYKTVTVMALTRVLTESRFNENLINLPLAELPFYSVIPKIRKRFFEWQMIGEEDKDANSRIHIISMIGLIISIAGLISGIVMMGQIVSIVSLLGIVITNKYSRYIYKVSKGKVNYENHAKEVIIANIDNGLVVLKRVCDGDDKSYEVEAGIVQMNTFNKVILHYIDNKEGREQLSTLTKLLIKKNVLRYSYDGNGVTFSNSEEVLA